MRSKNRIETTYCIIIGIARIGTRSKIIKRIRSQLFYRNSRTAAWSQQKQPVLNRRLIDRASIAITAATAVIASTEVKRREETAIIITILAILKTEILRIIRETWTILVRDRKTRIILGDSRSWNILCVKITRFDELYDDELQSFGAHWEFRYYTSYKTYIKWSMFSSLVLIDHDSLVHI